MRIILAIVACSVLFGATLGAEHPKREHPMAAKAGALDGKTFTGELAKSGATKGDKDTLTFKDGTFVSSACVAYGFRETPYQATEKDGVVTFAAVATNDKGETMSWTGTIRQGAVEATAVNKTSSGNTSYSFKGVAGPDTAKERPKKSEHPEHPK